MHKLVILAVAIALLSAALGAPEVKGFSELENLSVVKQFLSRNNCVRSMHGAPKATYSCALEASAKWWAAQGAGNECMKLSSTKTFEHSDSGARASQAKAVDSSITTVGENLAWGYTSSNPATDLAHAFIALDNWYDGANPTYGRASECGTQPFSGNNATTYKSGCGHYTQVIWDASTAVGCAVCNNYGGSNKYHFLVCHYGPAGNFMGQFPANVHKTTQSHQACGAYPTCGSVSSGYMEGVATPTACSSSGSSSGSTPPPPTNTSSGSGSGSSSGTVTGTDCAVVAFSVANVAANGLAINGDWAESSETFNGKPVFTKGLYKLAMIKAGMWAIQKGTIGYGLAMYGYELTSSFPCKIPLGNFKMYGGSGWVSAAGSLVAKCSDCTISALEEQEEEIEFDESELIGAIAEEEEDSTSRKMPATLTGAIYGCVALVAVIALVTVYKKRRDNTSGASNYNELEAPTSDEELM